MPNGIGVIDFRRRKPHPYGARTQPISPESREPEPSKDMAKLNRCPEDGLTGDPRRPGRDNELHSRYEDRRGYPDRHQGREGLAGDPGGQPVRDCVTRTKAGLSTRSLRTGDWPSGSSGRFHHRRPAPPPFRQRSPHFLRRVRQEPPRSQAPSYLTPSRPPHARRSASFAPTPTRTRS